MPRLALPFAAAVATALLGLLASRSQLPAGGPGVLSVTVPVPALLMLGVALAAVATLGFVGLAYPNTVPANVVMMPAASTRCTRWRACRRSGGAT